MFVHLFTKHIPGILCAKTVVATVNTGLDRKDEVPPLLKFAFQIGEMREGEHLSFSHIEVLSIEVKVTLPGAEICS